MQWNNPEKQKEILGELARTIGKFALVEHGGAPSEQAEDYRTRWERIYSGNEVPKMKRTGHFFSSANEVEQWMKERGIRFERLKEKRIDQMSTTYEQRYNLSGEELQKVREIIGNDDFYILTDWVIYPKD